MAVTQDEYVDAIQVIATWLVERAIVQERADAAEDLRETVFTPQRIAKLALSEFDPSNEDGSQIAADVCMAVDMMQPNQFADALMDAGVRDG